MPAACTSAAAVRSLWLVRHGESTWNTLGLAQGHNDQARLTARGLRQAAEVARQFRGIQVRAVYASDLRRARQTAAPLAAAAGLPVVLDARLRERSLGVLEGTPANGHGPSATGLDLAAGLLVDPDRRPRGGESVRDLYLRAAAFCDDLASGALPAVNRPAVNRPAADRQAVRPAADRLAVGPAADPPAVNRPAANGPEGDVVVVAHGGTLRVLCAYLNGIPVDEMGWEPLANATVLRFPEFGTKYLGGTR